MRLHVYIAQFVGFISSVNVCQFLVFNCTMCTTYLVFFFSPPCLFLFIYFDVLFVRIQRLVTVSLWDINNNIWLSGRTDRWLASSVLSHPSASLLTAQWHSVTPVHSGELIAFTLFRHLSENTADGLRRANPSSKPGTLWSDLLDLSGRGRKRNSTGRSGPVVVVIEL